jgi:hypothetical protein
MHRSKRVFHFPAFSLTENRISQPQVVPNFQPSQKSMNKREALNKKIYYVAPRLHTTIPVSRLMQKGPRKRHLAVEACTTTGPPTRERFRFLLGPPSYIHTNVHASIKQRKIHVHMHETSIIICSNKLLEQVHVDITAEYLCSHTSTCQTWL